jgi:hypothetical protein
LARTRLITAAITVSLAVLFSYLLMDYVNQSNTQKRLNSQILQSEQTLSTLPSFNSGLTNRLKEIQQSNQALKDCLAGKGDSMTDLIDRLLQNAEETHIQITPLTSGDYSEKTIGQAKYRLQPLDLTISGKLPDILLFMEKVENPSLYPSLIVTHMTMNNKSSPGTQEAAKIVGILSLAMVAGQPTGN